MIHDLKQGHCSPCEGGTPPLSAEESAKYLLQLKEGWDLHEGKLRRWFNFSNFEAAMEFVDKIAEVASAEGHHPDIRISYNKVLLEMWTHAIHGLSDNDFILAAKIDILEK